MLHNIALALAALAGAFCVLIILSVATFVVVGVYAALRETFSELRRNRRARLEE